MSQAATEPVITPGRPIRLEPTAPGFWMTILGVAIAALAPLLGFLTGSSFGRPDGDVAVDPLYWGLFAGVLIGALGVLLAIMGSVRLWRHTHREPVPGVGGEPVPVDGGPVPIDDGGAS